MIVTPRLLLRPWKPADRAPFARMNADPEVRRYFPDVLTVEESDASIDRFTAHYDRYGYTFFAAELRDDHTFVGFVGLINAHENIPLPDGYLEAGWRIDRAYWGKGLATEGALACVRYALEDLGAAGVGAITTVANAPSINVMRKTGMTLRQQFMHPDIDAGDPIAPHVLYALANPSLA